MRAKAFTVVSLEGTGEAGCGGLASPRLNNFRGSGAWVLSPVVFSLAVG